MELPAAPKKEAIFVRYPNMTIKQWRRKLPAGSGYYTNPNCQWLLHNMELTDHGRAVMFAAPASSQCQAPAQ
jgi:hypothetical protein